MLMGVMVALLGRGRGYGPSMVLPRAARAKSKKKPARGGLLEAPVGAISGSGLSPAGQAGTEQPEAEQRQGAGRGNGLGGAGVDGQRQRSFSNGHLARKFKLMADLR